MKTFTIHRYDTEFLKNVCTVLYTLILAFLMMASAVLGNSTDITASLKKSIQQTLNMAGDFDVVLDNPRLTDINENQTVVIKHLTINDDKQRFSAQVTIEENSKPLKQLPVSGRIQILMPVPVLTRPMGLTESIQEADIHWENLPINRVNPTMITSVQDLIGKTPLNRILQPGQPIHRYDVRFPVIVRRNSRVTVVYQTENMRLSRHAEAQQDGAKGETIRLIIPENKKVITGKIVGPNQVEIQA